MDLTVKSGSGVNAIITLSKPISGRPLVYVYINNRRTLVSSRLLAGGKQISATFNFVNDGLYNYEIYNSGKKISSGVISAAASMRGNALFVSPEDSPPLNPEPYDVWLKIRI